MAMFRMYHDWLKVVAKTVEKYAHLNQAINTEGVNDQYIRSCWVGCKLGKIFQRFLYETDLIMLVCSCFQTGECRNLFEISLISNSEENAWRNTNDTIEFPRNIEFFTKWWILKQQLVLIKIGTCFYFNLGFTSVRIFSSTMASLILISSLVLI